MTIAVLGGYGAVGQVAARQLHAWGVGPLLLGGRNLRRAQETADPLGAQARPVDVDDPSSLADFCAGAHIVLNCAGPAYRIGDRVAVAAQRAGAHYVDAAGDDDLHDSVATTWQVGSAVISAGMMPGLTGLLPRWAAEETPAREMVGYVGGRDRFTHTAAADYLAVGDGFGEPLAAWRRGAKMSRALAPLTDAWLPFFPEPVTAQPYLSTETERLALALRLDDVRWYSVFAGERTLSLLRKADSHDDASARLCRAAELDLFGHARYQQIVIQLGDRTVVLRGVGASELTGAAAALATHAVSAGTVPPGVHHACEVLDPRQSVALLQSTPVMPLSLTVHDGSMRAVDSYHEGVL